MSATQTGSLYRLDFADGKRYIGVTTQSMARRVGQHISKVARGAGSAMYSAWRECGAPRVVVLARAGGAFLFELERRAIGAYGTLWPTGYNTMTGGEMNAASMPHIREKISAANRGREISATTRAKLAASRRGRPLSAQCRAKISAAFRGKRRKPFTPEHLANMAAAQRGKTLSAEHRRHITEGNLRRWARSRGTVVLEAT
jgi:hypothetical protein